MTATCPHCGAKSVNETNHGTLSQPHMCYTYACGTLDSYDGPSIRGKTCIDACETKNVRQEISEPNIAEVGKPEIAVVPTIPKEIDASASGFSQELHELDTITRATVERLVKEASALSADLTLDDPSKAIKTIDAKRLEIYRERIRITGSKGLTARFKAWVDGAKLFVASKTDPVVSMAQAEETRLEGEVAKLKAEVVRRENVAKAARDAEIQANVDALAAVGLTLPFAAVAALSAEDYTQMLADQTAKHQDEQAKRAAEDERAAARARLISDRRDLIEYEWMFNALRLPEISDDQLAVMDAAIWATWLESAKAEATRKRDAGKLRAEREKIVLERELDEFFPRTDLAELTQDMFEAACDAAQVARDTKRRNDELAAAQKLHTDRVAFLMREEALGEISQELLGDLSKIPQARIDDAVERARGKREKAKADEDKRLLELRHARMNQLESIYPGWTDTFEEIPEELSESQWAAVVARCQQNAREAQELREAERTDREKIAAWAAAAVAAIPALPVIASDALREEAEACDLDVRSRWNLLQVETKENA